MEILHIESSSGKKKIDEVWLSQETADGLFSLLMWLDGMSYTRYIRVPGHSELRDFYNYLYRMVESKQVVDRNTKASE